MTMTVKATVMVMRMIIDIKKGRHFQRLPMVITVALQVEDIRCR
jgi:hypothetical protein